MSETPTLTPESPRGRLDVAARRLADRGLGRLEQHAQMPGLRDRLMPVVDRFIRAYVPDEPVETDLVGLFERLGLVPDEQKITRLQTARKRKGARRVS